MSASEAGLGDGKQQSVRGRGRWEGLFLFCFERESLNIGGEAIIKEMGCRT